EERVRRRMEERQRRIAAGEDCQNEYKSNAEVCVTIRRAEFDCNKSIAGSYYTDCDVTLKYDLRTNYAGRSSLSVDVQCKVEIEYSGRESLSSGSDSGRKSETHNLYARSDISERFRYNFSFSS